MLDFVDAALNRITMYRLVVYALASYTITAIVFAFMHHFSFTPSQLVISLAAVLSGAYLGDRALAKFYKVPTNMESALITALILFLIVQPANTVTAALLLVVAGVVSSVSKFIISFHGKHIFNPAAFAAAFLSLSGLQAITWWIGSSVLWPITVIGGVLIIRKIRRFPLVLSFVGTVIVLQTWQFIHDHQFSVLNLRHALLASPLIFLASLMLTEPATMPPRRAMQLVFASLVGILYVFAPRLGPFSVYPEVALLIGNIFAFAVAPKFKVRLRLVEIQKISERVYHYVFQPDRAFSFLPGQYMEWTMAGVPYDSRGNRRTYTIASSPTEPTVQVGLKYFAPASTYKKAFHDLPVGAIVYGSQIAGNFTLPKNSSQKLAFIAGGIGITPFRSMIQYIVDNKISSDIVLLYIVSKADEFAYMHEFQTARSLGVKTVPVVTDLSYRAPSVTTAKLTGDLLTTLVPDYDERLFYISGSNAVVDATKDYLRDLGVPNGRIKTDHFSGY